ncbi:MAG TPA: class I SAM-dependent methyltransferase [Patescibacteria group bacterium]|nr:class I SAM-dependent methyltransferase [Patescibacteria group bacterium]
MSEQDGTEIITGSLQCVACTAEYQILRGVPRMISGPLSYDKQATAEAFGYEWTHFSELEPTYRNQFLDWIKPTTPGFFRDKVILDAGCGKGRHAYLASQFGALDVIGIDLSGAVEAAFANTRVLPNVHIVQADIFRLPFRAPFDFIYSIGVIHHLPDPRLGFLALFRHLKTQGRISVWVYGKEGNWWIEKIANPIRVNITSKLPKSLTKLLAFFIALPLQFGLAAVYRPVNELGYLQGLRRYLFYNDYLYSISRFSFRENMSIIFDHMVAPTAFYISRGEIGEWFEEAGLAQVAITQRNRNSWRGTGVRQ